MFIIEFLENRVYCQTTNILLYSLCPKNKVDICTVNDDKSDDEGDGVIIKIAILMKISDP